MSLGREGEAREAALAQRSRAAGCPAAGAGTGHEKHPEELQQLPPPRQSGRRSLRIQAEAAAAAPPRSSAREGLESANPGGHTEAFSGVSGR